MVERWSGGCPESLRAIGVEAGRRCEKKRPFGLSVLRIEKRVGGAE